MRSFCHIHDLAGEWRERETRERGVHRKETEEGDAMLPIGGVPDPIRKGLQPYRDLIRRAKGLADVSRDGEHQKLGEENDA